MPANFIHIYFLTRSTIQLWKAKNLDQKVSSLESLESTILSNDPRLPLTTLLFGGHLSGCISLLKGQSEQFSKLFNSFIAFCSLAGAIHTFFKRKLIIRIFKLRVIQLLRIFNSSHICVSNVISRFFHKAGLLFEGGHYSAETVED